MKKFFLSILGVLLAVSLPIAIHAAVAQTTEENGQALFHANEAGGSEWVTKDALVPAYFLDEPFVFPDAAIADAPQAMEEACTACTDGVMVWTVHTDPKPYYKNIQTDCTHHSYGTDLYDLYEGYYEGVCDSCGTVKQTASAPVFYKRVKCGGYYAK